MSSVFLFPADLPQRHHHFAAGETLFRRGDRVQRLYAVNDGRVRLIRYSERGTTLTLQRATAGQCLAEASLFAPRYHCDAVSDDAQIVSISRRSLRRALDSQPALMARWLTTLAAEVQLLRGRAELLTAATVAERLDAWLTLYGPKSPTLTWRLVAEEIAVSAPALYRELARRRATQPAMPDNSE